MNLIRPLAKMLTNHNHYINSILDNYHGTTGIGKSIYGMPGLITPPGARVQGIAREGGGDPPRRSAGYWIPDSENLAKNRVKMNYNDEGGIPTGEYRGSTSSVV